LYGKKTMIVAAIIVMLAGTLLAAHAAGQTESEFHQLIQEIAAVRSDLSEMENRILDEGSDDLLQDEIRNFEFEQRIQQLGEALLGIEERFLVEEKPRLLEEALEAPPTRESQIAGLELLRIEEMIALAKGEIAAAWQESGLIQQKLTLELKRDIAEGLENLNIPPVACFDPVSASVPTDTPTELIDCSGDPDGEIVRWRWDFGDGTSSDEPNPAHVFPGPGTYEVTLEVEDDQGAIARITKTVEVLPAPPVACIDAPLEAPAGSVVKLIDCSTDPDGEIVNWTWSLGDGSGSTATHPEHIFETPGIYTVTLQVTDDQGLSDSTQHPITIVSAIGNLEIVLSDEAQAQRGRLPKDILLVLDLSSSMADAIDGTPKIEIARMVLREIIEEMPEASTVGLRTFKGCGQSDLLVPLQPLDRELLAAEVGVLETGSKTPLAYTIGEITEDLRDLEGPHLVILVTDGMETCGGDPVAAAGALAESGADILFRLVGYDPRSAGEAARQQFLEITAAAGGYYVDAQSADELLDALRTALPLVYRILDEDEQVVREGVVGEPPVELPIGTYSIIVETTPRLIIDDVVVGPNDQLTITVSPE